MRIDFGTVKTLNEGGLGIVKGFLDNEDVFFDSATVKDRELKHKIAGGFNQSYDGLTFWFAYEFGAMGPFATNVWSRDIQDMPDIVIRPNLEDLVTRLCSLTKLAPDNRIIVSQVLSDKRVPEKMANRLLRSKLLLSNPEISIKVISDSYHRNYAEILKLASYGDSTKEMPDWVEPVTKALLGEQTWLEIQRRRQSKIEDKAQAIALAARQEAQEERKWEEKLARRRAAREVKKREEEAKKRAEIEAKRTAKIDWWRTELRRRERQEIVQGSGSRIIWKGETGSGSRSTQVQNQSGSSFKPFWRELEAILRAHHITKLYHFTDVTNIPSIKRYGGLYSWAYLEANNIPIPRPGGDYKSRQLDARKGLKDYVRLSFNSNQPMMHVVQREGRINNPVILEIDPRVIYWANTLFSNINAADNNAWIGSDLENFKRIQFNITLGNTWVGEDQKKMFQAEVLVKTHIPLEYIRIPMHPGF